MQSQRKFPRTFSFEFFPPSTPEGMEKLRATTRQLAQLKPKFFSVTFGAGGSTRERTLDAVLDIRAQGLAAAPHISCVASNRESVRAMLQRYKDHGIAHLVALRGDLPSVSPRLGSSATPMNSWRLSATSSAAIFTSRSLLILSTIPKPECLGCSGDGEILKSL